METVEDFLNEYKNLGKMSKEEIIYLVKKDILEHLDSYKDYKKGEILDNSKYSNDKPPFFINGLFYISFI